MAGSEAESFSRLWRDRFLAESPPGMTWSGEKNSWLMSSESSSTFLDCRASLVSALNRVNEEEDAALQRLERILFCRECLESALDGRAAEETPTKDDLKMRLTEAIVRGSAEMDAPVYDEFENNEKQRTKSQEEEQVAPNMYSHPSKGRLKSRARPSLENVFINNGVVVDIKPVTADDSEPVVSKVKPEEGDSGYDALYEAIEDVQACSLAQPVTPSVSSPPVVGGSLKVKSPLSRPFVPKRTSSLSRQSGVDSPPPGTRLSDPPANAELDRPYQSRPRTVYVENPSAVAPPLPQRYHLPIKKVNSVPANQDAASVFTFDQSPSTSPLRKMMSMDEDIINNGRCLSTVSDASEDSSSDSNYERVTPFNRLNSSNGIYYSPVSLSRATDHDGIYEDISETSRFTQELQTRWRSSSSLVSDDGILELDEFRSMIQSFTACPEDPEAIYASLPRKCLKNLTCSTRSPPRVAGDPTDKTATQITTTQDDEITELPARSSSTTPTPTSSHETSDVQLDLVEMLDVLADDSQRKIYVASILDNEKEYLRILGYLIKLKKNLSLLIMRGHLNSIALEDLSSIFFMIAEIHKIHDDFAGALEVKMSSWSPDSTVADVFQNWIRQLHIYEAFLRNYSKSLETLRKCKGQTTNEVVNDVLKDLNTGNSRLPVSLEDLLMWPVNRMQRTSLYIEELLRKTPKGHSDRAELEDALKNCSGFFAQYNKTDSVSIPSLGPRRILKSAFHVELDAGGIRKLRLFVLFNDAVACFKQVSAWGIRLDPSNKWVYQLKWAISLGDLSIDLPAETKKSSKDVDQMKTELQDLTLRLQQELSVEETEGGVGQEPLRRPSKPAAAFKRIKKNWEQKLELWSLESPSLVFMLWNRRPDLAAKKFVLLMSSDWTRQQWREAIDQSIQKFNAVYIHNRPAIDLDEIEVEVNKPENRSSLPEISAFGSHLMERDSGTALTGLLSVKVGKAEGLTRKITSFCRLEVDQYNNVEVCAKTNLVVDSSNPHWNDEFPEIELRSSHKLNILMYKTTDRGDEPIARGSLNLAEAFEKKQFLPNQLFFKNVELLHQQENYMDQKISVSVEIIFFPTSCLARNAIRTPKTKGYFGVPIKTIVEKERSSLPLLVSLCVAEVEKRGFEEQGIYRVNGVIRGINKLKQSFEEGQKNLAKAVADADIHVVTGVLKTFCRELPHPLFTDLLYPRLAQAIEMTSLELKRKMMLELFQSLPEPNKSTTHFLLTHLLKIPRYTSSNKMTLHALATVFGPTLVRPPPLQHVPEDVAPSPSHIIPSENLRLMQSAVIQTSVVHLYLQYLEQGFDLLSGGVSEMVWDPQTQSLTP